LVSGNNWRIFPCSTTNWTVTGQSFDPEDDRPLPVGNYLLLNADQSLVRANFILDVPRRREYSTNYTTTPLGSDFTNRVRDRDRRCCFSGERVVGENFVGFETAHIFPRSQTDEWAARGFARYINDPGIREGQEINSVQQGFLATSKFHKLFDDYQLGVNPDNGYQITDFGGTDPDFTLDGQTFYVNGSAENIQPSADLLRDHFRQCVLACMKAVAEPRDSEARFDPEIHLGPGGFDLSSGYWVTADGAAQMETELFGRLASQINV